MINLKKPIIIAGPCAVESKRQIFDCAKALKKIDIQIIRTCNQKPRTSPGFDGIGNRAIPWVAKIAQMQLVPAAEVILPKHVSLLTRGLKQLSINIPLLLWIGARNQNHLIQKEIAKRIISDAPEGTVLMIKNQMWADEKHWLGIINHVLAAGFPEDKILLCHRGFCPNGGNNPHRYRNLPDFKMAMRVKQISGRPIILDPSHIGGSSNNVFRVVKDSMDYDFDGLIVEVHPEPQNALTDANQQLKIDQLKEIIKMFGSKIK